MNCPICSDVNTYRILKFQDIPIFQNLNYETVEEAFACEKGVMDLFFCHRCGFIYNAAFESDKMAYSKNYENNQIYSSVFSSYIDEQINWIYDKFNLSRKKNIIEIGCGKGYYLDKLSDRLQNVKLLGFDPSYSDGIYDEKSKNISIIKDFFSEKYSDISPDIIICRHVIEHISNPLEFLSTIYQAIKNNIKCRLFFETPDAEYILKNNNYFDLPYEHCSYFSSSSIIAAFEKTGFHVVEIVKTFKEQYMWVIADICADSDISISNELDVALVDNFSIGIQNFITKWQDKLKELTDTAVWGGGRRVVCLSV